MLLSLNSTCKNQIKKLKDGAKKLTRNTDFEKHIYDSHT